MSFSCSSLKIDFNVYLYCIIRLIIGPVMHLYVFWDILVVATTRMDDISSVISPNHQCNSLGINEQDKTVNLL